MLDQYFDFDRHHMRVAELIQRGAPGFAQSVIGGRPVSYAARPRPVLTYEVRPQGLTAEDADERILERLIIDVARGHPAAGAMASARAFARERVERLTARLTAEGLGNEARAEAAQDLRCFYLDPGAVGAIHLHD